MQGTLFKPGGVFQGGSSANVEARASKWDERRLEALRAERDALRQEQRVRVRRRGPQLRGFAT